MKRIVITFDLCAIFILHYRSIATLRRESDIWLNVEMINMLKADDYVVAKKESHTVEEFLEVAFGYVGLNWKDHVAIDKRYFRSSEVDNLKVDASKADKDVEMANKEKGDKRKEVDLDGLEVTMEEGEGGRVLGGFGGDGGFFGIHSLLSTSLFPLRHSLPLPFSLFLSLLHLHALSFHPLPSSTTSSSKILKYVVNALHLPQSHHHDVVDLGHAFVLFFFNIIIALINATLSDLGFHTTTTFPQTSSLLLPT
ncbi:hypothetical protein RIF29_21371 [Crotalaria pallida]|uniref:NAD(P)-binding domain-containing protein n=1 Tax=Crotalaria pallida TaxID=3830 RepID=A0AAN9F6I2_CROPI